MGPSVRAGVEGRPRHYSGAPMNQMKNEGDPAKPHWRYWHTLAAFAAGVGASLAGSVVVLFIVGGASLDAESGSVNVEISNEWTFWFLLPVQLFANFLVLRWLSRRHGTGDFANDFSFVVSAKDWPWILAGVPLIAGSAALAIFLKPLFGAGDDNPQALVDMVAGAGAGITAFAIVAGIGIFGPIIEEVMFRGLLYDTIRQRNSTTVAVIGSSVAFSLPHLLGFNPSVEGGAAAAVRLVLPPLIVLFGVGLVLALVRAKTKSLSAPILLHSSFNIIQVMALLFASDLVLIS